MSRCVSIPIVRWKQVRCRSRICRKGSIHAALPLSPAQIPCYPIDRIDRYGREIQKRLQRKRLHVADTTKVEDKLERKKLKRIARKKAAPKAKRTGARGEKKKKVKKLARGVSKR
jgi:hypothetical protein